MSRYTPSTEWVRIMAGWAMETAKDRTLPPELARQEGYDWFDRWLAAHVRAVKAEAWAEGYKEGLWARHADEPTANPYRKGADA